MRRSTRLTPARKRAHISMEVDNEARQDADTSFESCAMSPENDVSVNATSPSLRTLLVTEGVVSPQKATDVSDGTITNTRGTVEGKDWTLEYIGDMPRMKYMYPPPDVRSPDWDNYRECGLAFRTTYEDEIIESYRNLEKGEKEQLEKEKRSDKNYQGEDSDDGYDVTDPALCRDIYDTCDKSGETNFKIADILLEYDMYADLKINVALADMERLKFIKRNTNQTRFALVPTTPCVLDEYFPKPKKVGRKSGTKKSYDQSSYNRRRGYARVAMRYAVRHYLIHGESIATELTKVCDYVKQKKNEFKRDIKEARADPTKLGLQVTDQVLSDYKDAGDLTASDSDLEF